MTESRPVEPTCGNCAAAVTIQTGRFFNLRRPVELGKVRLSGYLLLCPDCAEAVTGRRANVLVARREGTPTPKGAAPTLVSFALRVIAAAGPPMTFEAWTAARAGGAQ